MSILMDIYGLCQIEDDDIFSCPLDDGDSDDFFSEENEDDLPSVFRDLTISTLFPYLFEKIVTCSFQFDISQSDSPSVNPLTNDILEECFIWLHKNGLSTQWRQVISLSPLNTL